MFDNDDILINIIIKIIIFNENDKEGGIPDSIIMGKIIILLFFFFMFLDFFMFLKIIITVIEYRIKYVIDIFRD